MSPVSRGAGPEFSISLAWGRHVGNICGRKGGRAWGSTQGNEPSGPKHGAKSSGNGKCRMVVGLWRGRWETAPQASLGYFSPRAALWILHRAMM